VTDPASVLSRQPVFDPQQVGEILTSGRGDRRWLYDRLNARTVLRLLFFDHGELTDQPTQQFDASAAYRPQYQADLLGYGGAPDAPHAAITPPSIPFTVIPEPLSAAMIGLGALVLAQRRKRAART
jgi:hypothetical protein